MVSAFRGEAFRGGFLPFAAGSDVPMEGEDAVVDRLSSAGLQDDRGLFPGQVSHVKDGIGEAGKMLGLQTMLYSVAIMANAPISGGRDL